MNSRQSREIGQITFDCDADGTGAWDEHRIVQAISNLASNAMRHGTPGSPTSAPDG